MKRLTGWTVVGPLEFKQYILKEIEKEKLEKVDYSKWNKCSICMCELFEAPFEESSVEKIAEQEEILIKGARGLVKLDEYQRSLT